jgi:RNA polymerase sigma-70 factor (ECF subfamily)
MREGLAELERGLRRRQPGPYQVQAAIAALHMESPGPDWPQIAALYETLDRLAPSPVVEINRAVAVAFASGPRAGLELLAPLLADPALERYQPLHAAHAGLLRRAGDLDAAAGAYAAAIALSTNAVERADLERRLAGLSKSHLGLRR